VRRYPPFVPAQAGTQGRQSKVRQHDSGFPLAREQTEFVVAPPLTRRGPLYAARVDLSPPTGRGNNKESAAERR